MQDTKIGTQKGPLLTSPDDPSSLTKAIGIVLSDFLPALLADAAAGHAKVIAHLTDIKEVFDGVTDGAKCKPLSLLAQADLRKILAELQPVTVELAKAMGSKPIEQSAKAKLERLGGALVSHQGKEPRRLLKFLPDGKPDAPSGEEIAIVGRWLGLIIENLQRALNEERGHDAKLTQKDELEDGQPPKVISEAVKAANAARDSSKHAPNKPI